jgi:hypothetical protein
MLDVGCWMFDVRCLRFEVLPLRFSGSMREQAVSGNSPSMKLLVEETDLVSCGVQDNRFYSAQNAARLHRPPNGC